MKVKMKGMAKWLMAHRPRKSNSPSSHLLEDEPECALCIPRVLAQAVGPLARKQRDGERGDARTFARNGPSQQGLVGAGRAMQQNAPVEGWGGG